MTEIIAFRENPRKEGNASILTGHQLRGPENKGPGTGPPAAGKPGTGIVSFPTTLSTTAPAGWLRQGMSNPAYLYFFAGAAAGMKVPNDRGAGFAPEPYGTLYHRMMGSAAGPGREDSTFWRPPVEG